MNFVPTEADPDVWLSLATTDGGFDYYEMICVSVEDMLSMSKDPMALIKAIQECNDWKSESMKLPDLCLEVIVEKVENKNRVPC